LKNVASTTGFLGSEACSDAVGNKIYG